MTKTITIMLTGSNGIKKRWLGGKGDSLEIV